MSKFTMTTADDLCRENGVYLFQCNGSSTTRSIGAISIGMQPKSWREPSCDQELAEYVRDKVLPLFNRRIWLFLRTGWLVQNRITACKKLWKHFQLDLRWDLSGFTPAEEIEIIDDNQVCYAGVMEAAVHHFPTVVEILRHFSGFLVLSNRSDFTSKHNIGMMFDSAYPLKTSLEAQWQSLSECMCPLNDVVVRLEPIWDLPPRPYESALDFFVLSNQLADIRVGLTPDK